MDTATSGSPIFFFFFGFLTERDREEGGGVIGTQASASLILGRQQNVEEWCHWYANRRLNRGDRYDAKRDHSEVNLMYEVTARITGRDFFLYFLFFWLGNKSRNVERLASIIRPSLYRTSMVLIKFSIWNRTVSLFFSYWKKGHRYQVATWTRLADDQFCI